MDATCSGHETPKRSSYSSAVNAPENTIKKTKKKEKKNQKSYSYQIRISEGTRVDRESTLCLYDPKLSCAT